MKYIKTYNQLINESRNFKDTDSITLDWCNNIITEKEFFDYIEQLSINEGWFDDVKKWVVDAADSTVAWFKEKFFKILMTFLKNAIEIGSSIIDKILKFTSWVFDKLNKFADKHPTVWKVILISLIIFICLVVCASTVKAQTTGQPIDTDLINASISLIKDKMDNGVLDPILCKKAMAYLVDMKDGHQNLDPEVLGKSSIDIANNAMRSLDTIRKNAPSNLDFADYASKAIEEGSKYIKAEIIKHASPYGDSYDVAFGGPKPN